MRAPLHNYSNARLMKSLPLLVPAAVIPLVLMGVTGIPTADGHLARTRLEEVREQLEVHEERLDELHAFGPYEELATLEELAHELRQLIPQELSDIEIYSAARMAAKDFGVQLTSIQIQEVEELETSLVGRPLATHDARILGAGTLDGLVAWIDGMRRLGVPCAVHQFTVSRSSPRDPVFRFEVRLGAFQYAPEESGEQ